MRRPAALFVPLVAIASLASAAAHAKLTSARDAQVRALASGPGGLKIEAKTADLRVDEADDKIKVTVPLAGLQTGIDLRDRHMREKYLEVGTYPHAELVVARAGFGYLIGFLGSNGTYEPMFAVVLTVAFLGFVADRLYQAMTRRVFA